MYTTAAIMMMKIVDQRFVNKDKATTALFMGALEYYYLTHLKMMIP